MSIKGVGLIAARTLRAVIDGFDRLGNGTQCSRECGLWPHNASSNARMADAGIVRAGDADRNLLLIQAAHRVVGTVPKWRRLEKALLDRGKPLDC